MSKVPLVKWRKGYTLSGGVHNVTQELKMAPDWGALLHFKYLEDFKTKVDDALDRQQHAVSSRFYKDYVPHLDRVMSEGAFFEGSERFESAQSILNNGLMRMSPGAQNFLAEQRGLIGPFGDLPFKKESGRGYVVAFKETKKFAGARSKKFS